MPGNKSIHLALGKQRQHLGNSTRKGMGPTPSCGGLLGRIQKRTLPIRHLPALDNSLHSSQHHGLLLRHLITGSHRPSGRSTAAARPTHAAIFTLASANFFSRFFHRYQQLTPTTNTAASTQPDSTLWKNLLTAIGEVATAQKSTISLRAVSGLNSIPTGFCIHALATRIHQAEIVAPSPGVSQVEARWKAFAHLIPTKEHHCDERGLHEKAKIPSMASGAPKMSPTNQL